MTKSIFITGTGTDIGKTYVSSLIVKKMTELGYSCGYFKPVLSGALRSTTSDTIIPGDCKYVLDRANLKIDPVSCLSYCFEEAVSPHLASKRAGVSIDKTKIIGDYHRLSKSYDYMVIEGAGGITCPICVDDSIYLMSDLILDFGADILIVADSGLGTLNHIVLTVEYAKQRNINIKGIILNNFDESDFMHQDNLYMTELLAGKVVAKVVRNDVSLDIAENDLISLFK